MKNFSNNLEFFDYINGEDFSSEYTEIFLPILVLFFVHLPVCEDKVIGNPEYFSVN